MLQGIRPTNEAHEASTEINPRKLPQTVSLLFIALCCAPLLVLRVWMLSIWPLLSDFISYWSSGQLFLHGGRPYLESAMLVMEHLQGWPYDKPLVMLCPPWSLPFVSLITWLPFRSAQAMWLPVSMLLDCLSALGLWSYFGGERRRAWVALLVAATFFPMGAAELLGQVTPFMLASLTGFLLLLRSERHFLAGLALVGVGFKPQLLHLVALAILCWIVRERAWRVLVGAASAYGAATIVAYWINPASLDYFGRTYQVAVATSCGLGGVLRDIFGTQHAWLQFLPSFLGGIWFVFYWLRHRLDWNWRIHLPLLLLVSVSSSPYFWDHDFILILPAVIAVAAQRGFFNFLTLVFYLAVQAVSFAGYGWGFSVALRCSTGILWIPFYLIAVAELGSVSPVGISLPLTNGRVGRSHGD